MKEVKLREGGRWWVCERIPESVIKKYRACRTSTGIKDSEGNEIRGGDILVFPVQADSTGRLGSGCVIFMYEHWYVKLEGFNVSTKLQDIDSHTIQVIGNIHDNPELIKGALQ